MSRVCLPVLSILAPSPPSTHTSKPPSTNQPPHPPAPTHKTGLLHGRQRRHPLLGRWVQHQRLPRHAQRQHRRPALPPPGRALARGECQFLFLFFVPGSTTTSFFFLFFASHHQVDVSSFNFDQIKLNGTPQQTHNRRAASATTPTSTCIPPRRSTGATATATVAPQQTAGRLRRWCGDSRRRQRCSWRRPR